MQSPEKGASLLPERGPLCGDPVPSQVEVQALCSLESAPNALAQAQEVASDGSVPAGYALLWRGAERGHTALAAGQPWGSDLLQEWRRALELYADRYADRYHVEE